MYTKNHQGRGWSTVHVHVDLAMVSVVDVVSVHAAASRGVDSGLQTPKSRNQTLNGRNKSVDITVFKKSTYMYDEKVTQATSLVKLGELVGCECSFYCCTFVWENSVM